MFVIFDSFCKAFVQFFLKFFDFCINMTLYFQLQLSTRFEKLIFYWFDNSFIYSLLRDGDTRKTKNYCLIDILSKNLVKSFTYHSSFVVKLAPKSILCDNRICDYIVESTGNNRNEEIQKHDKHKYHLKIPQTPDI